MSTTVEALERVIASPLNREEYMEGVGSGSARHLAGQLLPQARLEAAVIEAARELTRDLYGIQYGETRLFLGENAVLKLRDALDALPQPPSGENTE